ncbi:thiamine phosphate synthase [Halothiobacillus sp.]|uniref:thiamine phosphate synthase n=1 Tax=Halothiobacillus sp. TaxID=1891311 RepID=UPI00260FABAC|nr:thiamine phosphate synthase [Halothiobacillus sp.]MDD4966735.1 thiamine phosphate synthase [Halothiobacillus sp.]
MRHRLYGLYVITDTVQFKRDALVRVVAEAIAGGARIVQYRDKSDDSERRLAEASALRTLTLEHEVLFLINDDLDLAEAVAADGVHLGREDGAIEAARARLGAEAIIGASCYNSLELAGDAVQAGADYVAFGAFFPSRTKPDAAVASMALLIEAKQKLNVPICAIGGITKDSAPELISAGADMLAVISAVFSATDIKAAARDFSTLWPSAD